MGVGGHRLFRLSCPWVECVNHLVDTKTHLASCIPPMHFQQPYFHTFLPLCTCPLMFIISTQATRYPIVTIGHATMCISLRYLRFQAPISGTSWPPEKGDTRIRVACGKRNDTKTLPGLGSLAPFDPVLATGKIPPWNASHRLGLPVFRREACCSKEQWNQSQEGIRIECPPRAMQTRSECEDQAWWAIRSRCDVLLVNTQLSHLQSRLRSQSRLCEARSLSVHTPKGFRDTSLVPLFKHHSLTMAVVACFPAPSILSISSE